MRLLALGLLVTLLAGYAAAQEPAATPPTPQDTSLAARLARAERLLALIQEQVAEQARSGVATRSGSRVELSGLVLVNAFYNNGKVNNSDVPQIGALPDPPGALPASHLGATARQTELRLTASVPRIAGGAFTGELDVDFYGGQQPSPGGRTWPLLRLRRIRAEIDWSHAWLMFGQEGPPIAEVNPSSLAEIGLVGFARAGNLWLWIPQVRAGIEAGTTVRVGMEFAALAPLTGDPQGVFATQPDAAERSRRPSAEGRLRVRWEDGDNIGELSVGGHYGWVATGPTSLAISRAVVSSARITATRYLELRGEVFTGQALAGLGGGGIGQNLGPAGIPIRTQGGWVQLNVRPQSQIELGGGYGLDDPEDLDLDPAGALARNTIWESHLHWRPKPLVLGVAFRRIRTTYTSPPGVVPVNHVNLAAGFEF